MCEEYLLSLHIRITAYKLMRFIVAINLIQYWKIPKIQFSPFKVVPPKSQPSLRALRKSKLCASTYKIRPTISYLHHSRKNRTENRVEGKNRVEGTKSTRSWFTYLDSHHLSFVEDIWESQPSNSCHLHCLWNRLQPLHKFKNNLLGILCHAWANTRSHSQIHKVPCANTIKYTWKESRHHWGL